MGSCASCGRKRDGKWPVKDDGKGEEGARGNEVRRSAPAEKGLVFPGKDDREEAPFSLEDLLMASSEVLGKGTSGTTYRSSLRDGSEVVVKRLKKMDVTPAEYEEWVAMVGAMEHPNLLRLKAYHVSRDENLLVYDYMPMGSLMGFLHAATTSSGSSPPSWRTRLNIALTAARGIEYIHSRGPNICHGGIRSSNVLLDGSLRSIVSDPLLPRLMIRGASAGPNLAPEIGGTMRQPTQEADVYSFGALLLELLAPPQAWKEGADLVETARSTPRERWTSDVIDQEIDDDGAGAVELLELAVSCCTLSPDGRPSMSEVVARIEEIESRNLLVSGI